MIVTNVRITNTSLGMRGGAPCMTCYLTLEWPGAGQGFGGYAMDEPVKRKGRFIRRRGTAFGMEFIARILEAIGVECWEDLKGKYCRIKHDDLCSASSKIYAIGHIVDDKWFCPDELIASLKKGRR